VSVALRNEGFGGRTPSSYSWTRERSSARRQAQSAFVRTLAPDWNVKGSGRVLLSGNVVLGWKGGQAAWDECRWISPMKKIIELNDSMVAVGVDVYCPVWERTSQRLVSILLARTVYLYNPLLAKYINW